MSQDVSENKEYRTGGWSSHYILIVCTLLYIINYMDRQVFSVILQPMKMDLGLSDAQCGLAQTIFILATALFSFPVAYLIDRWSRRKTISLMAIFWSAFTFVTGMARDFIGVLIPRVFVGAGEAGFVPGGVAMISSAYSKKSTARVMGIFNLAGPIGAALGVMLGGIISHQFGWRTPFYIFAIPGILLAIFAFFMKDYKTVAQPGNISGFGKSVARLLRIRTLVWFYLGYAAFMFMFTSTLAWFPSFIMRVRGIDEAAAGTLWGVLGLIAIVGAPLGGFLADAWQKKNPRGRIFLPAVAWLLASIFTLVALFTNFNTVGIVFATLSGVAGAASFPALYTISQDVVHTQDKGLSMGIAIFAQYMLGGAWGPFIIGAMSDGFGGGAIGLSGSLMVCTVGGILGFVLLLIGSRFYSNDVSAVGTETMLKEN